ncbi:MAG: AI-2E family transporter [Desulfuromonadaceae bacterium]|nr:AI-2E family transporter [Desulfuromonadaceae bacterium]
MAEQHGKPSRDQSRIEQNSFLFLLVLVTLLFLFLLKPFWGAIFWAGVIGLIFHPLYRRLLRTFGRRRNLAALATLSVCVVIGVVPMLFVAGSFFQEGAALYQRLQSGDLDLGNRIERIREAFPAAQNLLERVNLDLTPIKERLSGAALSATQFIARNAVQLGQGTVQFFVSLALMLYMAFFLLRDGKSLVRLLVRALPLGDERERLLFGKFAEVVRATVKGNLLVATAQGTLGGLIFWLLDIPGALLWGVVMALLSLIPVVGAGLIWGPVAIYLLAIGDWTQGLILFGFGAAVIGLVDNLLRPLLVGRDTKLPDYVVLLSTLGGFVLFGMNGFVIGPLVAALFVAFWGIFMREFNVAGAAAGEEDAAPEEERPGAGG